MEALSFYEFPIKLTDGSSYDFFDKFLNLMIRARAALVHRLLLVPARYSVYVMQRHHHHHMDINFVKIRK